MRNVDRQTAELARELIWKNRLKPRDAIYVATALQARLGILDTFDKELIGLDEKLGSPLRRIGMPHERAARARSAER